MCVCVCVCMCMCLCVCVFRVCVCLRMCVCVCVFRGLCVCSSRAALHSLPAQDLADAAVADPQLAGDVAGSHSLVCHVHDPLPDDLRERASIYKHAT